MLSQQDLNKMYWHSRRGMLELDLLLVPFAQEQLVNLSKIEQAKYRDLLKEEDQDLFNWLMKRSAAPNRDLQEMIALILSYNESKASGLTT